MSKQIIVKPQGIVIEPNDVGQYPAGAFSSGTNFAIRSFGVVEQVLKLKELPTTLPGNLVGGAYVAADGNDVAFLVEAGALTNWYAILFHQNDAGALVVKTSTITFPFSSYITSDTRTGVLLMRNRLIVTAPIRSFVIDYAFSNNGNTITASDPRICGVAQAAIINRTADQETTDVGGVLGPNQHFAACVQMRWIHSDGYELISPASVPYDFANLSTTATQTKSVYTVSNPITLGSTGNAVYIDTYRTREQSVGYDSVNNKYAPISTGSSFYRCGVDASISTPEISGDSTLNSALGEALLTNVAANGASALPLPPAPSKTCARFRNYAFYANRFDPATVTIQNPYFWGALTNTTSLSARKNGVGVRLYTGASATSGNATISLPSMPGGTSNAGVQPEQDIIVRRADTNAIVLNGTVASPSGSFFINASVNSSYTGTVNVELYDIIEVNGARIRADFSPQLFATNLSQVFFNKLDVTASGLEPQESKSDAGVYPSFVPTGGLTIRMRTNQDLDIRATNSGNYTPGFTSLPNGQTTTGIIKGTPQPNGIAWSEENEPENCPPSNFAFIGSGEIYKIIATRDCLWAFCSDGLFRLSGTGGSAADGWDWVIDPIDPGLVIAGVNCAVAHRDYVYAYTNRGFVSISSEGNVRELSDGRINPASWQWPVLPNETWSQTDQNGLDTNQFEKWVAVDAINDDIWIRNRESRTQAYAGIWVYNTKTDTWSFRQPSLYGGTETPSLAVYSPTQQSIFGVYGSSNKIVQSVGDVGDYEAMGLVFQPIYGGRSAGAHTQKHWQDVQISFRTPQINAGSLVTFISPNLTVTESRVIPQVSNILNHPATDGARVGFTVARNHPAMSNTFVFELVVDAPVNTGFDEAFAIEAISVNYIDFSDDRKLR